MPWLLLPLVTRSCFITYSYYCYCCCVYNDVYCGYMYDRSVTLIGLIAFYFAAGKLRNSKAIMVNPNPCVNFKTNVKICQNTCMHSDYNIVI